MEITTGPLQDRSAAPDHREVEWQFDAADVRPVGRWLEAHAAENGLSVAPSETRRLTDTYLDTDDWRLYRAGYALRVRRRGKSAEAAMKSLSSAGKEPGLRDRREISEPLEDADPESLRDTPGPVGERVRALAGRRALSPIFKVRTRRSAYALTLDGAGAGEVALDETEIPLGGGRKPGNLRRVEVEAEPGSAPDLEAFLGQLRAAFELSPATSSKFEAAFLARGLEPPGSPDFGPTRVEASLTVGEVAFAVMREQFVKFLAHEPGTRLGEDPEELHDMRVASRRSRAAMQIFKEALPAKSRGLRDELKHFAGVLGEVRDLDVQLEQLGGWISEAAPEDREPLGALISVLEERRRRAHKKMLRALDSRRYERFVERFSAMLRRGPIRRRSKEASQPVLAVAPDLVRRRYRKVRKVGDEITAESSAEEYHELRKRGKRLRYALEFLSDVYGKPATKLIKPLKALQDVLGDHQDAVVAMDQLRELAETEGRELPPRAVFVMGGISHRYEARAEGLRTQFPKAYAKIRGKRWKKLRKAMEKGRPDTDQSKS